MKNRADIYDYAYYNEIICRLIFDFQVFSQIKISFLAYAIKNLPEDFKGTAQKYGTYSIIINGVKDNLQQNISQFCIIFDCLELLKNQGYIQEVDDIISIIKVPKYSRTIDRLNTELLKSAIQESEKLSSDSIIRGVIEYV